MPGGAPGAWRRWVGLGVLLLLLGLAMRAAWVGWVSVGDTEVSGHGFLALALGIFFSLAVAGGLVALLLYSRRNGYDQ